MEQPAFLAALSRDTLYEKKTRGVTIFKTSVDYPDFNTSVLLEFRGFESPEEVGERFSAAFAAKLRDNFPALVKSAMRYAAAEKLICNYMSRSRRADGTLSQMSGLTYLNVLADELPTLAMEPYFIFQGIHVYKDKPGIYLEFDAGDADDSDPENFEYLELYRYIGFDENLELTGDYFDETIWR